MALAPEDRALWDLQGTPEQNTIVEQALNGSTYPYRRLRTDLEAKVGKTAIPVQWADLSNFQGAVAAEGADDHDHDHDHDEKTVEGDWEHVHVEDAHGISYRGIPLGLAYYSGKVVLHAGLISNPRLAQEVFLSEAAHMIDFFEFNDEQRRGVYNALHAGTGQDTTAVVTDGTDLGHGHGWFDVDGYRTWAGEAWMGLFVRAYSKVGVSIPFTHPPTDEAVAEVRSLLTPEVADTLPKAPTPKPKPEPKPDPTPVPDAPAPDPTPDPTPDVTPEPPAPEPKPEPKPEPPKGGPPVWSFSTIRVYHTLSSGLNGMHYDLYPNRSRDFANSKAALEAGYAPCRACRP